MLSKNKIRYLSSLADKKTRMETGTFLVEGEKMVSELIASSFTVQEVFFTEKMASPAASLSVPASVEKSLISESEASRISTQRSPQGIFALAAIPGNFYSGEITVAGDWMLVLHDIQDPGNLGTIVRTADWFGVRQILCSKGTADILNPKVLQSTMGSVFRVKLHYADLSMTLPLIKSQFPELPLLAAVLEGSDLYGDILPSRGIIMMGNESKGLSPELIRLATHKVTIPRFGKVSSPSESLNVSVATAIILSEACRRMVYR